MPPIPIYTKSPISAAAAVAAVTPKTEDPVAPAANQGFQPQQAPATTTAAAGYALPPAQPGAVPRLPQPTDAAACQNSHEQQYGNAPIPTPTTTFRPVDHWPPPPQPGAVPQPPAASAPYQMTDAGPQYWSNSSAAAPAPAAAPPTTAMPPQMAMAPVSANQFPMPSRGTAPATQAYGFQPQQKSYPYGYPSRGPGVAQPGCHPPGYVQTVYAVNSSGSERASSQRPVLYDDGSEEGLWSATKKLAAAAGSKFSAAESEVWRRINGKD